MQLKKNRKIVKFYVIMSVIVFLISTSLFSAEPDKKEIKKLPNINFKTYSGGSLNFYSETEDKIAIVWMTNLCEVCQEEIEGLEKLSRKYKNDIVILAISILDNDVETVKQVQNQHNFSFPLLLDPNNQIEKKWGYKHYFGLCPLNNTFIQNREGVIVYEKHLSTVSEQEFEEILLQIINDK